MRVAMTSGEGPIGLALQKVLAGRAIAFRALVASEPPRARAAKGDFLIGTETDLGILDRLLKGVDAFVHIGPTSLAPNDDVCQKELAAQAVLLPALARRGIALHFISSNEVFSPAPDGEAEPVSETAPAKPSSEFGMAKVSWEQELRLWGTHRALRYVIYRVPLAVPEFLIYNSLSARYLRAGFKTGEIFPHAYDEGRRWGTCYVHAEDVARVLAESFVRADLRGEVFHLASDSCIAEVELAELSYRVLCDFMVPCKWRPPSGGVPPGLVGEVWLDNRKAKQILGLDVANSVPRLIAKLRVWVDDFGSTARLKVAQQ